MEGEEFVCDMRCNHCFEYGHQWMGGYRKCPNPGESGRKDKPDKYYKYGRGSDGIIHYKGHARGPTFLRNALRSSTRGGAGRGGGGAQGGGTTSRSGSTSSSGNAQGGGKKAKNHGDSAVEQTAVGPSINACVLKVDPQPFWASPVDIDTQDG